ncbi:hypothetical protein pb186bvf_006824 [Paramecium bursaria]
MFEYQSLNQKFKNESGEEIQYIMEDKIKLNCGCCKVSFTVCDTIKGFLALAMIIFMLQTLYFTLR